MNRRISIFLIFAVCMITALEAHAQAADSEYLNWNQARLEQIGEQMRQKAKVGSSFSLRGINTQRAINYKMRATLMSPEMIRASARLLQLQNRLTDDETRTLVQEAEEVAHLVIMVELDPNEGSGVIPLDWRVFLQPKGQSEGSEGVITGIKSPEFRRVKALSGVFKRKYDYDVFFVAFPLVDEKGNPLISDDLTEIELVVGISSKEGRVSWNLPDSIRKKMKALSKRETVKNEN